jgi:hypothetical protein
MSITEQQHFSLMAEFLDPDLPDSEQIKALLQHAEKELALTVNLFWPRLSKKAGSNLDRAFVLNDVLTAMQSAVCRLLTRWNMQDSGQEIPPDHPEYLEFLKRGLVPDLQEKITRDTQCHKCRYN